jgi:hypothetical protein
MALTKRNQATSSASEVPSRRTPLWWFGRSTDKWVGSELLEVPQRIHSAMQAFSSNADVLIQRDVDNFRRQSMFVANKK